MYRPTGYSFKVEQSNTSTIAALNNKNRTAKGGERMNIIGKQLTMDHVLFSYDSRKAMTNEEMYEKVALAAGVDLLDLHKNEPIGRDGREYSKIKRGIRWFQQELKRAGLLENVGRAEWKLTREGKAKVQLHQAINGFMMLAFSTKLGVAIWGDSRNIFSKIKEPIHLTVTSPPYPIQIGRAYGTFREDEVINLIIGVMEPIIANLVDGGSIMLNLGNNVFERGSAARSMWIEKLTLKLHEKLDMWLMDKIIWNNTQSAPAVPTEWCAKKGIHLAATYETILWMCNNPNAARTNNRNILRPLSEPYKKLMQGDGEKRERKFADGAHTIRKGSFSNQVEGALPKNIYSRGHRCKHNNVYRKYCRENNLPVHGATYPFELAEYLIKFASSEARKK